MKKVFLFGASALLMLASCTGKSDSEKANEDNMTSYDQTDYTDEAPDTNSPTEASFAVETPEEDNSLNQESNANIEKENEIQNEASAKYNPMLDKYQSLIKKCWSMSKKGLTINDQELADIWMEAGQVSSKLNKVNKKLTPEQQSRLKKLNNEYKKFCQTQPA